MVEYKLYYFDLRALAEVVRLVFAAAGQKYEDVRFTRDKWPEWKPKAPLGKAPFLEVTDGSKTFTLSQSKAIARYLSRKFGLAGKDEDESALIDMYADQLGDLVVEFLKYLHEENDVKKQEVKEKLEKEILPVQMKYFDERLAKSGSGYIASSGLSWVDLYLYTIVDLQPNKDEIVKQFKHIRENRERVEANPGISHWFKIRPVTPL